eukprot:TRINITY_DN9458_c0_g1_i1.p1 TRINITY_DN9458_c0_g1~~TRINITY_DN9458_c0_g1_i1.p1  ORF type:complete len:151 (-),score=30.95 TRINITY_DN9458_c0_g1_i1:24-437(-)
MDQEIVQKSNVYLKGNRITLLEKVTEKLIFREVHLHNAGTILVVNGTAANGLRLLLELSNPVSKIAFETTLYFETQTPISFFAQYWWQIILTTVLVTLILVVIIRGVSQIQEANRKRREDQKRRDAIQEVTLIDPMI